MIFDSFLSRSELRKSALALYRAAVEQARRPEFYLGCGAPDTLDGRFDMVVLHVFLVLRRLRDEGKPGSKLAQKLFDVMFDHFDQSLREMGVGDLSVGKKVKTMASAFYGRAKAYDAALAEGGDGLAQALERNLYGGANPDPAELARIVGYVRGAAARLAGQSGRELLAGKAEFGPAPGP